MIYRKAGAEYMVTINTAFSWLLLLMGCHTQRRFQPSLLHLKVPRCVALRTATTMEDTWTQLRLSRLYLSGCPNLE